MVLKAVPIAAGQYLWSDFNFSEFPCISEEVKIKRKILRLGLFLVLTQSLVTTSETKPDYYHRKVNLQVALQVAERLAVIHSEKAPSNKTPTFPKSISIEYQYHLGDGCIKSTHYVRFLKRNKIFEKIK